MNGVLMQNHPLLQALGFTVLHSLWQGTLLFFLLKFLLSFVRAHKANTRYAITYTALTVLFFLFVYTFVMEWNTAMDEMAQLKTALPEITAMQQSFEPAPAVHNNSFWQKILSLQFIATFRKYTPLVSLLYTLGIVVLCIRMIWQLARLSALRKDNMAPAPSLAERFLELSGSAGIRKKVLLKLSLKVNVPMMIGHIKPLVLLPVSLVSRLDMQQLETILLHELGHIRRNDYLWNMIQIVMETILFFNPVAWWCSAIIRQEREHRCDDFVLKQTNKSLPYAHALLALEEYRLASYSPVLYATGNTKSNLFNRIKRITTMTSTKNSSQRTLATVAVLVLVAAMICFATAFSQQKKGDNKLPDSPPVQTKVTSKHTVSITDKNGVTRTSEKTSIDTGSIADAMKIVPQAMKIASDAIEAVDWNEIRTTVSGAVAEASKEMENADWTEINQSVDEAMKEARNAIKGVDWNEINQSIEDAKKEVEKAMKEMDTEMGNMNINIQSMKEKRVEVQKKMTEAKQQRKDALTANKAALEAHEKALKMHEKALKAHDKALVDHEAKLKRSKELLEKLERKGLLDQKAGYDIRYNKDKLVINGKEQPESVVREFRHYFQENGETIISSHNNSLSFTNNYTNSR